MTERQCKSYFRRKVKAKEDGWFTADEALSYGFVDGIFGSTKYNTIEQIKNIIT